MKTIKLLLLAFVLTFTLASSCSPEDQDPNPQCDCVKTYYMYYPSMGSGASYIPEHYDAVDTEVGQFECEDETGQYVPVSNTQYSHYKIQCD